MFKKSTVAVILISFIWMSYFSCTGEYEVVNPEDQSDGNRGMVKKVIGIEDVGKLHNQVLTEFNDRIPLKSGNKVDIETFVRHFIESANKILEREDYVNRVNQQDVARVLKKFLELKSEGTINFFDLPEDIPEESMKNLVEKGYFPKKSAEKYLRVFREIKAEGRNSAIFHQNTNLFPGSSRGENERYEMFVDVSKHSYTLWSSLYDSDDEDTTVIVPEKIEQIETIYWDAVGALAGVMITGGAGCGVGGILGGLLGSIVFIVWGDDVEDWTNEHVF